MTFLPPRHGGYRPSADAPRRVVPTPPPPPPSPGGGSRSTELEAVDHAAEHYAQTGSPVCWCDFAECERRARAEALETLIYEYAVIRGDLTEQYARDQLRDKILALFKEAP